MNHFEGFEGSYADSWLSLCSFTRMYIPTYICVCVCTRLCVYVNKVHSTSQGSSGTLDCVLTCLSKPSHERTEEDIEGLLDVLAMLPVSI